MSANGSAQAGDLAPLLDVVARLAADFDREFGAARERPFDADALLAIIDQYDRSLCEAVDNFEANAVGNRSTRRFIKSACGRLRPQFRGMAAGHRAMVRRAQEAGAKVSTSSAPIGASQAAEGGPFYEETMSNFVTPEDMKESESISNMLNQYMSGSNQLIHSGLAIRRRLSEGPMTTEEMVAWLTKAADVLIAGGDALGEAAKLGQKAYEGAWNWRKAARSANAAAEAANDVAAAALGAAAVAGEQVAAVLTLQRGGRR